MFTVDHISTAADHCARWDENVATFGKAIATKINQLECMPYASHYDRDAMETLWVEIQADIEALNRRAA